MLSANQSHSMNANYWTLSLILPVVLLVEGSTHKLLPSCDSPIYCYGDLLHVVQTTGVFPDSKTFVDMTLLRDPSVVRQAFQLLLAENNGSLTRQQAAAFVNNNFESGLELERWTPADFNPFPRFLHNVTDDEVRTFAWNIIQIWPQLAKKVSSRVLDHPDRHSIIHLPNGIIVPGGRFRESYYWDTYWIVKGLLVCEMHETARGLLDNFVHLIKTYGFIPNGGRVYYTRRAQPPLFTAIVMEYFQTTGDVAWIANNIEWLEAEVNFWETRKIKVGQHRLARYLSPSSGPRPESYREDFYVALGYPEKERNRVYEDLKGGAESGWDYSSRWFYGSAEGNISEIQTRRTLPVDLNAYLGRCYKHLAHFYRILHRGDKRRYWYDQYRQMKAAIFDVFWNETDGIWFDLDLDQSRHRRNFYPSNLTPIWAEVYHNDCTHDSMLEYLNFRGIFEYLGGTPASTLHTGEQWDYPNAWPPMQDIIVSALQRGNERSVLMAERLADLWITANMMGFNRTGQLFEKYDALAPGRYGGGGEYVVQAGFGWTNGVALDLIKTYFTRTN